MRLILAALLLVLISVPALAQEKADPLRFPAGHMLDARPFARSLDYPRAKKRAYHTASVKRSHGKLARPAESVAALDPHAPVQLNSKVIEIIQGCGSHIVSGFRPGATVHGRPSNHALHRAYDLKGNPSCIYAHLQGWPGGYSTDYHSAPGGSHVHISYNPNKEWGLRFVHNGGRYARRHGWRS